MSEPTADSDRLDVEDALTALLAYANSLRESALSLATAGRLADATKLSGLAVTTLRAAGVPADDSVRILLATMLSDHAANLAETGQATEGMAAAAEAAGIWRSVCEAHPRLRRKMVNALANQAWCLRLQERDTEAASVYEQACGILRELSADSPGEWPMLADLLGHQAYVQLRAGRYAYAALARAEEVGLRRDLRAAVPDGDRRLADTLTEYAVACDQAEHPAVAMKAADEAVAIYRDLYGAEPGPEWARLGRGLLVGGKIRLRLGQPVQAVGPFASAMAMALKAGDTEFASSCRAGISLAREADPAGFEIEWKRLTGG